MGELKKMKEYEVTTKILDGWASLQKGRIDPKSVIVNGCPIPDSMELDTQFGRVRWKDQTKIGDKGPWAFSFLYDDSTPINTAEASVLSLSQTLDGQQISTLELDDLKKLLTLVAHRLNLLVESGDSLVIKLPSDTATVVKEV